MSLGGQQSDGIPPQVPGRQVLNVSLVMVMGPARVVVTTIERRIWMKSIGTTVEVIMDNVRWNALRLL